jgi:hypothetical protein
VPVVVVVKLVVPVLVGLEVPVDEGEVLSVLVPVLVTLVLVVGELVPVVVPVVVPVLVSVLVGEEVGLVISQSAKVPSSYEFKARFMIATLASHFEPESATNPARSHSYVPLMSPREYSSINAFSPFADVSHPSVICRTLPLAKSLLHSNAPASPVQASRMVFNKLL